MDARRSARKDTGFLRLRFLLSPLWTSAYCMQFTGYPQATTNDDRWERGLIKHSLYTICFDPLRTAGMPAHVRARFCARCLLVPLLVLSTSWHSDIYYKVSNCCPAHQVVSRWEQCITITQYLKFNHDLHAMAGGRTGFTRTYWVLNVLALRHL